MQQIRSKTPWDGERTDATKLVQNATKMGNMPQNGGELNEYKTILKLQMCVIFFVFSLF